MEDALKAAINFVEVCCQHAAYVTGRQTIENEIKKYKHSKFNYSQYCIILHIHMHNQSDSRSFIAHRKMLLLIS